MAKAMRYLARFETTVQRLREKLDRDIFKSLQHPQSPDKATLTAWRDAVIADCLARGYVSDDRYTDIALDRLIAAGSSPARMRGHMKARGVDHHTLEAQLASRDDLPSDLELAWTCLRKKRRWIFRTKGDPQDFIQKDKAFLARQGFGYDTVDRVFQFTSEDAFEAE